MTGVNFLYLFFIYLNLITKQLIIKEWSIQVQEFLFIKKKKKKITSIICQTSLANSGRWDKDYGVIGKYLKKKKIYNSIFQSNWVTN